MKELTVNYEEMPWEDARGYPPGTLEKVLRVGETGDHLTVLLKLPQNFQMEGHSHMGMEQHFVLEGEYESEDHVYRAGSYRLIPQKTTHGPFRSQEGALLLVVWDAK
jgi:anti-sigma factor ChrR (cupin superfamily)